MVFVGEVSGTSSTPNPTIIKLPRLTPGLNVDSYHVADKDLLTIRDIGRLLLDTQLSPTTSRDLAIILADYHMPFLTGHSVVFRSNALRKKLVYYTSAKVYDQAVSHYGNSENPKYDNDSGTSDLNSYERLAQLVKLLLYV